jgi:hypothetical protein
MDKFYIKEGEMWLGPLSEIEFEFRKSGKESFEYWKTEFCSNHILHPQLCAHTKTWVKSSDEKKKTETVQAEKTVDQPDQRKEVILNAEAMDRPEESEEHPKIKETDSKQTIIRDTQKETNTKEPGTWFKIMVIIIGFVLVLGAGFYVNSKLSVLFYQDIIIQESVRNIEYYSRDMIRETDEIKLEIDTLNARFNKEINIISKEIQAIKKELREQNPVQ